MAGAAVCGSSAWRGSGVRAKLHAFEVAIPLSKGAAPFEAAIRGDSRAKREQLGGGADPRIRQPRRARRIVRFRARSVGQRRARRASTKLTTRSQRSLPKA